MFYWDTGDRVVDVLLRQMEGQSRYEGDPGGEPTHQLLTAMPKRKQGFVAQHVGALGDAQMTHLLHR